MLGPEYFSQQLLPVLEEVGDRCQTDLPLLSYDASCTEGRSCSPYLHSVTLQGAVRAGPLLSAGFLPPPPPSVPEHLGKVQISMLTVQCSQ